MNENKYLQARLTLCLFLKTEAEAKGITQQQIADKCGWHQQTVQRMLSGKFAPSLDNFIKLADAIGESGVKATSQQRVRKYRKLITQKFAKK